MMTLSVNESLNWRWFMSRVLFALSLSLSVNGPLNRWWFMPHASITVRIIETSGTIDPNLSWPLFTGNEDSIINLIKMCFYYICVPELYLANEAIKFFINRICQCWNFFSKKILSWVSAEPLWYNFLKKKIDQNVTIRERFLFLKNRKTTAIIAWKTSEQDDPNRDTHWVNIMRLKSIECN